MMLLRQIVSGRVALRGRLILPEVAKALRVLLAAVLLLGCMKVVQPSFDPIRQLAPILVTAVFLLVASFGQGLVILLGGIDLSMGVVIGIGGTLIAQLTRGNDDALIVALPLTLAACTGIGVINGLAVAVVRLPPFIATLSSSISFFGVALGLTAGGAQQPVAPALQRFMNAAWLGVPMPIIFIVAFSIVAWQVQNRSVDGRRLYAIGGNRTAALVAGLPITTLTIATYAISGLCAGVAGVLLAAYSASATIDMGNPLLMPSIAAVVIGGARVSGGYGHYLGTVSGALFLSVLSSVITVLSLSQGFREIIQGSIILVALLLQTGRLAPGSPPTR
jgi:ribose transport system permease protein